MNHNEELQEKYSPEFQTPPVRPETPERVGIHHQFDRAELLMMLDYLYDTDKETYKIALQHVKDYIIFMEEQRQRWLKLNPSVIPASVRRVSHHSLYDGDSIFNSPILLENIDNELDRLWVDQDTPCPNRPLKSTTLTSDLMEATFSD
jgi:hypothetical protein